ncbi:MAG: UDP-2,3-diacylglucosamine diphosphatase [Bacteroidaceae bacterium]|nr:UDP-2,3-diacylglucosamine diphosphatase [Bacteroidaceae bacterium]
MKKNVYFISDAHLGSWALEHRRMQERRLVRFLDDIKDKAQAVYMLGDMFDYWYEYKYVVPKGYTRFLGKVSELTDMGVEVHYFIGNHDIWMYGYLEQECGVILHKEPMTLEIMGKEFFLAHGDGMGDPSRTFRFMRGLFRNKFCQFLFSLLPTRWSMPLGMSWAKKSMEDHRLAGVDKYLGEDMEFQVVYAKNYLKTHPNINYFIFGHRHIELDLMLTHSCRLMIIGDWISQFTYVVFDGKSLTMNNYLEGEKMN